MASIICTVTNDLSQDQRMIRICTSLQAAGYEVTLVGRLRPGSLPIIERSFAQQRIDCWFERGKLFYLEYNLRLFWFLCRHSADIINAVDLDTLLPGFLISYLRKRTSCVYDAHEYFTEVPEVTRRPAVQLMWSLVANWIIPQLDYAYTVGPVLAQVFTQRYGTVFSVVRNVPIQRELPPRILPPGVERVILYQGMLNEGRGLEVAIETMEILPEGYRLVLIGTGDLEVKLRDMVQQKGLNARVDFTGFIPPDELPNYTHQAWLGLNLLENTGLSYYYSLANKAFDYIQAGLPSVQMDFPEYRALAEKYACFLLLERLTAADLAQLILGVANTSNAYEQLVEHNRSAAKELNWEAEERQLLSVYQKLPIGRKD